MIDNNFYYKMQEEIIRLNGLPLKASLDLLNLCVNLENDIHILNEKLIHAIETGGEFLESDDQLLC